MLLAVQQQLVGHQHGRNSGHGRAGLLAPCVNKVVSSNLRSVAIRRLAASGSRKAARSLVVVAANSFFSSFGGSKPAFSKKKRSAEEIVRSLYEAVNARELDLALTYFADDCVYEDMIYKSPFVGIEAIREQFSSIYKKIPADMAFVIDDVSDGADAVGVTWHVELDGIPFPFGRGCSFIRLVRSIGPQQLLTDASLKPRPDGLITYVRDIPEPSSKPGDSTLWLLNALSALIRRYPSIAEAITKPSPALAAGKLALAAPSKRGRSQPEPPQEPQLPPLPGWLSPGIWAFYLAYMYALFLNPDLPGNPGINPSPETLQDVLDLSINFFYVSPVLNNLGVHLTPAPEVHPASLAIFNVVNAWSIMFLGLIARDPRGRDLPQAQNLWLGQVFLTNVFFIPYLALRAGPQPQPPKEEAPLIKLGKDSAAMGIGAIFILLASVGWFTLSGGDAYGSVSDRAAYAANLFATDRVWVAFGLDCVLYSVFQAWLIADERAALEEAGAEGLPPAWLGFVPYVGLGAWLALRPAAAPRAGDVVAGED